MTNFICFILKLKKFQSPAGFTLVEILISISIIALIGITFFPNLRKFNSEQQYRNESSSLKDSIESAKNMFTTSKRCTAAKAVLSWSVLLTTTGSLSYNQKASCVSATQTISSENLSTIVLSNLTVQNSTCGLQDDTIEFKFDKTGFTYSCAGGSFISGDFFITLQNKNNSAQTSTISINHLGVISQN